MLAIYSLILSIGFVLMLPLFILRRDKYASGFRERLGNYPEFEHGGRPVIWLHCVSVGETNAARPLVDELIKTFPDHRLVVSTTTKTGQELARNIFKDKAVVFYFPFDWKISVRRALANYKPSVVLLMETEIWPRFIGEAKANGAKVAIVNGRMSERSFRRYSMVRQFAARVLGNLELALMQTGDDMRRMVGLGMSANAVSVTGNLKFDIDKPSQNSELTQQLRKRFAIGSDDSLIVAASTHAPEERVVLDSFIDLRRRIKPHARLMIAPRHPERFDEVFELASGLGLTVVRRSANAAETDKTADVILLDTIGELRAVFPLAAVVFVGGSLIPHGGQSILEPAAAGKAIVTGPHTHNFHAAVREFVERKALVQLREENNTASYGTQLTQVLEMLLTDQDQREFLGGNAKNTMEANRGATAATVEELRRLFDASDAA